MPLDPNHLACQWPGEDESIRPIRRPLFAEPWKLAVLESMFELNSAPSALEILAAAVESGLYVCPPHAPFCRIRLDGNRPSEERVVRNWVRQRKTLARESSPPPPTESIPSASRARRSTGAGISLSGAAQPTELLDYSTMTIGAAHPANDARTSTPAPEPAPRRSSARISARSSTGTAAPAAPSARTSGSQRRALRESPTLGYVPDVFGIPAARTGTQTRKNADAPTDVDLADADMDDVSLLAQDDPDAFPKDSSLYMLSQLTRKLSISTQLATQENSFQPSLASTSYNAATRRHATTHAAPLSSWSHGTIRTPATSFNNGWNTGI